MKKPRRLPGVKIARPQDWQCHQAKNTKYGIIQFCKLKINIENHEKTLDF
jgi:hypothetical protein